MTGAETLRIDKTIDIDAPPERVFQALTTASELSVWFQMKVEGEIVAGSEVWMTVTMGEYKGQRFQVKFVEITPPRRFVWQWCPGAVDPAIDYSREPRTTVTFTLEPAGRGTRLSLAETGFDQIALARRAKVLEENTQGWAEVLTWIRDYVERSK